MKGFIVFAWPANRAQALEQSYEWECSDSKLWPLTPLPDPTFNNTYIFPFLITYWAQEVLPFVGRYLSLFEKWSRKVTTKRECNRELWVLVQSSGLHASELTKNVFVPSHVAHLWPCILAPCPNSDVGTQKGCVHIDVQRALYSFSSVTFFGQIY